MSKYISPVYNVIPVPAKKIKANAYNPNHVQETEMKLLYDSIKEDGYTMPIVCYYDKENDIYEIVDGFHRYSILLEYKDIYEREGGCLPVSIINKPLSDRMASTIRHNRARGTHGVELMSNIVCEIKKDGKDDLYLVRHLGMSTEEIKRLKQISGLAEVFKNDNFGNSWEPGVNDVE